MTPDIQELLVEVADRHRHPIPIDPLHARARVAIGRIGLDGSGLELAVAVFGWGSDEANGSLLGLVRKAWGDHGTSPLGITWNNSRWRINISTHGGRGYEVAICATEDACLLAALEARQP